MTGVFPTPCAEPRLVSNVTIAASKTLRVPVGMDLVSSELARVEARITEVIGSREPLLTEISDYLINAGGKRVRPAVSMLVFRACGGTDVTDMVDLSVSLELIHTATLLHDDIIDSNDTRRGKAAAPLRYGIPGTLVTGDFLFSRAFQICGRFDERIVEWAADACVKLTEGEVMQGRFRRNTDVREEHYLEIVERKTASLFSVGARIAAHLAGMQPGSADRFAECGRRIGIAFQMIDDVLDIEGDAGKTGKPIGTDLIDGNPSLPIVWGMDLAPVRAAFTCTDPDPDLIEEAIAALRGAGIGRRARRSAIEHAQAAVCSLDELPPSDYRDALARFISDLVDREL